MRMRELACAAVTATLMVWSAGSAGAQTYEMVGKRAERMGGALVALAYGCTATWWDPAGLGTGASLNVAFEHGEVSEPETPVGLQLAERRKSNGFSFAYPALGLSYYRLRVTRTVPPPSPTEAGDQTRQDSE